MKRAWMSVVGVALAACQGAPVEEQQDPIVNGTDDPGDPAVMLVVAQAVGSRTAALCGATLISPHVLLTAAHCLDPAVVAPGTPLESIRFGVYPGAVLPESGATFLPVAETHFDPAFDPNTAVNSRMGHDIGVIILRDASAVTPLPYNRAPLDGSFVGQPARLVGYGVTSGSDTTGSTAGTRRQAPSVLAEVSPLFLSFRDQLHTVCEGDSGGPALMTIAGVETVVSVTALGTKGCPPTAAAVETRVDAYLPFIDAYVAQFDPPPAPPAPAPTAPVQGTADTGGGSGCASVPGARADAVGGVAMLVILFAASGLAARRRRA